MTDVAGLVVGVVALYSACRDCYIFFRDVKNAERDSFLQIRDLGIQESIFKSWGFYWEIQRHHLALGNKDANLKLLRYLGKNIYKVNGIEQALSAMADTLSNTDKMRADYGIHIQHNQDTSEQVVYPLGLSEVISAPIHKKLKKFRHQTSVYRRARWVLADRDKFKALISDLKSYNDALYVLCPDGAAEAMYLNLSVDYLSDRDSQVGLRLTAGVAQRAIQSDETSPSQQGLRALVDVANIKANTAYHEDGPLIEAKIKQLPMIPDDDLDMRQHKRYGVAIWKSKQEVVYVELKRYRDPTMSRENKYPRREDVLQLARLLCDTHTSNRLYSLRCVGLAHFEEELRIGYVFRLPGRLGKSKPNFSYEDSSIRRPRFLFTRLNEDFKPPLGWRFKLAKKILSGIVLLHASGWLHKNLRASSILFFPRDGDTISRGFDGIDYESPFLGGYGFSRPEATKALSSKVSITSRSKTHKRSQEDALMSTEPHVDDMSVRVLSPEDGEASFHKHSRSHSSSRLVPTFGFGITPAKEDIELGIYHHPAKRTSPQRTYRHAYDIYSMGIVLLEIGLWSPIEGLVPKEASSEDPYELRRHIVGSLVPQLKYRCGEIYEEAVRTCLMIESSDSRRELGAKIAAVLAPCWA